MKSSAVSTITKSLPTEFCTLVSYCLLVNFDLINLFYIKMTAKEKGTFSIPKSRFDYKIYPYEEAFREEMLGPEEVLRTKNRISPQSNALNIIVE